MYYIYVLKNKSGDFYIGYTKNLKQRVEQHKNKKIDFRLVYCEAYLTERLARVRERKLKYYGSAWRALKERILA